MIFFYGSFLPDAKQHSRRLTRIEVSIFRATLVQSLALAAVSLQYNSFSWTVYILLHLRHTVPALRHSELSDQPCRY